MSYRPPRVRECLPSFFCALARLKMAAVITAAAPDLDQAGIKAPAFHSHVSSVSRHCTIGPIHVRSYFESTEFIHKSRSIRRPPSAIVQAPE